MIQSFSGFSSISASRMQLCCALNNDETGTESTLIMQFNFNANITQSGSVFTVIFFTKHKKNFEPHKCKKISSSTAIINMSLLKLLQQILSSRCTMKFNYCNIIK